MKRSGKSNVGLLISGAALVGFVGFGLGFNWLRLADYADVHWWHRVKPSVENLNYTGVEEVYDELRRNFAGDIDTTKLLEGAKRGLVAAAGDPYTAYLNKDEAAALQSNLDGKFSGIGAEIAIKGGRLVVVAPLAGSPAAKAGLAAGDQIGAIDGESTENLSLEAAVAKIRGPEGSSVKLTVVSGNQPARDLSIERSLIEIPAIKSKMQTGNIGYLQLVRFGEDTNGELVKAAQDLANQGATKFILDLRNNPGGLLNAAVAISDEFLDGSQTIVEEKKEDQVIQTFKATKGGALAGLPLVILINKGSASASEIVAGALKDNGVAALVGETSFGKGSVQQLVKLSGGSYLKVTIARWYTPKGRNISEEGIDPDDPVGLGSAIFNSAKDPQVQKAIQVLNSR